MKHSIQHRRSCSRFLALLFYAVLGNVPCLALVDMANMNLADSWTDIKIQKGFDISVERTYNSRSLYEGLFGFGWCSNFETKLTVLPDGRISITSCGAGVETIFVPPDYSGTEIGDLASQLVLIKRAREPGLSEAALSEYRQRILQYNDWRREAEAAGLGAEPLLDSIYESTETRLDTVRFDGEVYVRNKIGEFEQQFDKDGRLLTVRHPGGQSMRIEYNKGKVNTVSNASGESLTFSYDPETGRVSRIESGNNQISVYRFQGRNLVENTNAWGNTYHYHYDDLHNLTRIDFPDDTFKQIGYDPEKDWVISFRHRDGCVETYVIEILGESDSLASGYKPSHNHYITELTKRCDDKIITHSTYEFNHENDRIGNLVLQSVSSRVNGKETQVIYDLEFERPLSVFENGEWKEYRYDPDGQMVLSETLGRIERWLRDNLCNKPSQILQYSESGNIENVRHFLFNSDCLLVSAYSPQMGHASQLEYASGGSIVGVLLDNQRVRINYDEINGKPNYVEAEGIGALIVTHDDEGKIEKVTSESDNPEISLPEISLAVSRVFNKLVQLLRGVQEL